MDIVAILILAGVVIFFLYPVKHFLNNINKHLRVIKLQLEIQNPLFTTNELILIDQNIDFWHDKMWKYKDDDRKENKEISDLTFSLFWLYVTRLNLYRVMVLKAKHTGDADGIYDKYEKELEENEKETRDKEKRAGEINKQIYDELQKRNLDIEFTGEWNKSIE